MVVFEDTRPSDKLILYDKRIDWKDGIIEGAKTQGMTVSFVECVGERRQPLTPGEEGVQGCKSSKRVRNLCK
jgi:hypothetical protein